MNAGESGGKEAAAVAVTGIRPAGGLTRQDEATARQWMVAGHSLKNGRVQGTVPARAAGSITPGTASQTIPAGVYLAGAQTIEGSAALVPENIREGAEIFGVAGTVKPIGFYDTGLTGTQSVGAKSTATVSHTVNVTGYNAALFDCYVSSNGNGGEGYVKAGAQKVQGCAGYGGEYSGKLFVLLNGQTGNITLQVVSFNNSSEGSVRSTLRNLYLYNIPGLV